MTAADDWADHFDQCMRCHDESNMCELGSRLYDATTEPRYDDDEC